MNDAGGVTLCAKEPREWAVVGNALENPSSVCSI